MTATEYWSKGYTNASTTVQVAPGMPLPNVFIPYDLWSKMQAYVHAAAPTEVAGFGRTTRVEGRNEVTYVVNDIFILEQEVSGGHADTNGPAMHKFLYELLAAGADVSEVNFQWHSHVNGGTYFSPIDTANIDRWTGEMLISCVTNLRGEHNTRMDWYYPQLRFGIERTLIIGTPPIDDALQEAIAAEVAEKVKKAPVRRRPFRQRTAAGTRRNGAHKGTPVTELGTGSGASICEDDDFAIELAVPGSDDDETFEAVEPHGELIDPFAEPDELDEGRDGSTDEDDDVLSRWARPTQSSLADGLGGSIWASLPHLS